MPLCGGMPGNFADNGETTMAKKSKDDVAGEAAEDRNETETAATVAAPEAETVGTEGRRVRRVLMMKQLASPEWIMQNVVAKGKGTHVLVGRIYGVAHTTRKNVNDVNGRPVESIAVSGSFEAQSKEGELLNGATVYFPMAFAETIAAARAQEGVSLVNVDVDIGVEATGKTIPYEWTVTAYLEGKAENAIKALRDRRKPQLQIAAPGASKAA
jgi:hypothetical protein